MRDQTHAGRHVEGKAASFAGFYVSATLWSVRRRVRAISAVMAFGAVRLSSWRGYLVPIELTATCVAAICLVALFFWQIFVSMPHLSTFSGDTLSYMLKEPQRTPGVYYFWQLILPVWNNFYAIGVAQGLLLGAVGLLLAYSVRRATGSALLALAALTVCLFKESLVVLTQDLCSDSLFSTACLGLLAAALLLWERASLARILLFLLFAFAASIVRSVGAAILWPMVFALGFRLWATQRRALAAIVAGCIGVYGVTAAIGFINYGFWGPQARSGLTLITGAIFIADGNVPPEVPYPHKFAAASVQPRGEYEKASAWAEKFEIIDQYFGGKSWRIAGSTLFDRSNDVERLACFPRMIAINDTYRRAALAVMLHNPLGYLKMTAVKLVAGLQMLSSFKNDPLQGEYTQQHADYRIALVEGIMKEYSHPSSHNCAPPDFALMMRYVDDWRTTPLDLRSDVAKPLRDSFDLVKGSTINWLFIGETVIVFILTAGATLQRKRMNDVVMLLLLFIIPIWSYLLAICLVGSPVPRYMDATSPFVYIALLSGGWGLLSTCISLLRRATAGWLAVRQGV